MSHPLTFAPSRLGSSGSKKFLVLIQEKYLTIQLACNDFKINSLSSCNVGSTRGMYGRTERNKMKPMNETNQEADMLSSLEEAGWRLAPTHLK